MSITVDELIVKIGGDITDLQAAYRVANKGADTAAGKIGASFKRAGQDMADAGKRAAKWAVGIGVVAVAIGVKLLSAQLSSIDAQAKQARLLGVSVKALDEMGLAASLAGASQQELARSMRIAERRVALAAQGMGAAAGMLKKMGLSVDELKDLNAEELFKRYAEEIGKLPTKGARAAATMQLLGDESGAMLNVIEAGPKIFEQATAALDKFGGKISDVDANMVEQLNDNIALLKAGISNMAERFTADLAPAISFVVSQLSSMAPATTTLTRVVDTIVDAVFGAVEIAQRFVAGLNLMWKTAEVAAAGVVVGFVAIMNGVEIAIDFIRNGWNATMAHVGATMDKAGAAIDLVWTGITGTVKRVMFGIVTSVSKSMADLMDQLAVSAANLGLDSLSDSIARGSHSMRMLQLEASLASNAVSKDFDVAKQVFDELSAKVDETAAAFANVKGEVSEGGKLLMAGSIAALEDATGELFGAVDTIAGMGTWQDSLDLRAAQYRAHKGGMLAIAHESANAMAEQEKNAEQVRMERLIENEEALNAKLSQYSDDRVNQQRDESERNRALWEAGWKGKAEIISGILGDISVLMQGESRKMFEVGKAAAISETVISTILGAQKAFSALAGIPIVGPALGAAAAAAAYAAGTIRVQQLSSAKFGSNSGAGGGGGGGGGAAGAAGAAGAPPPAQQTNVNATLIGDSFSGDQIRGLIGQINNATGDNVQLNVR